jgi:amino acid adenylation domain-containing protein
MHMMRHWTETPSNPARRSGLFLHEIFASEAARAPDHLAVELAEERLTYRELDQRTNRLARHLAVLGVGPDMLVGILLDRSVEMIVTVLAVLKSGGAYVPLDPEHPRDRLEFILNDTGIAVLVTQDRLTASVSGWNGRIVSVDGDANTLAALSPGPVSVKLHPHNLAYVIFTSGSTGKPKGVLVEHRGLANLAEMLRVAFEVGETDHILQFARLGFDASIWEIAMALAAGASLHLLPRIDSADLISRTMLENRITIDTLPPSLLPALDDRSFKDLRTLIVAGEACAPATAAAWYLGRRMVNAYGPTETTVCASFGDIADPAHIGIGRPIANAAIYLLDEAMNPVPVGVAAELYVGGAGVARGYLSRPGLTAERFVPSPFGTGERLYRTGDLARYRPDGDIEFLGRIDHQIKVRGFRIEPGEIEAALRPLPGIRDVAVLAKKDDDGDNRLVAYLVVALGTTLDIAAIRQAAHAFLPDYMVPSAFVALDRLPLTPNGKLDRDALPAPGHTRTAPGTILAPRTPLEALLVGIWKQVLRLDAVGIDENFFDVGGNSLLIVKVRDFLAGRGVAVPDLTDFFRFPKIINLAEAMSTEKSAPQSETNVLTERGATRADGLRRLRSRGGPAR